MFMGSPLDVLAKAIAQPDGDGVHRQRHGDKDGAGDRDTLLLAAGKFAGELVGLSLESDAVEESEALFQRLVLAPVEHLDLSDGQVLLVASVAHEVGTPLHSIAWHVEALAEEPGVTPAMQKRIAIVDEQLNRVVRIIQDLLSSTRQRKPEPTWYPAERLIEPVVALMEPGYHAKDVVLQAAVAPALLVWADAEKIHQVLVNLLTNSLAATGAGGRVTVTVSLRQASADERDRATCTGRSDLRTVAMLVVSDSGCGMPQEDVDRVFQPFFTTKAMRRMLVSRSSLEKPRPFERFSRTMSPSRISSREPRLMSSVETSSEMVDLPAPESPVN